jgi:hypothetical protein
LQHDEESEEGKDTHSNAGTGRRGREPIPTMWTKVMKITQQYPEEVICHSMFVELTL